MRYFIYLILITCLLLLNACKFNPSIEISKEIEKSFPENEYFNKRMFPETSFDHKAYFKQIELAKLAAAEKSIDGEWVDQGPGNIGARINNIAINPENELEIYLGFARGGLYKTSDGGENWKSIFNEFSYLAISHIEIDPINTNIIYIGTGDENISQYPAIGNGVYKSEDGGETWIHLGLSDASIITKVQISGLDDQTLFASAMGIPFEKTGDRGVYKSEDGGQNWDQILFVNDSTGIIEMAVAPNNPDIIYAVGWNRLRNNNISRVAGPDSQIYKTEDGGVSWTTMINGLPAGEFTRIGLEMFDKDGEIVFASYSGTGELNDCGTGHDFYGLFKTSDGGENWANLEIEAEGLPCSFQGGFAWYFGKFAVNPQDENDITMLGVQSYRKLDDEWLNLIAESNFLMHVDFHDAVYFGENLYLTCDGGAYKYSPTEGWSDIENISTNQFYRVAYNPHQAELYYGGLQDNGVVGGWGIDINNWERISGGDGFQIRFDSDDSNIFYTESQRGNITMTTNGGNSFSGFTDGLTGNRNWDMQYILSPSDPKLLYTGTDKMFKRYQFEEEWTPISEDLTDQEEDPLGFYQHDISCLSQSSFNQDILYCGTSDGLVWATTNEGVLWNRITDGLPRRYITEIKASPSFESTVFVTTSGYKNNDFTPHIFRSDNNGIDWVDISSDLPQIAINDVLIHPFANDDILFVATEAGVYVSLSGGESWDRLGDDFPYIQCLDLEYNQVTNELIVGTFGKGLRTFDLGQITNVASEDIPEGNGFRVYPSVSTDLVFLQYPKGEKKAKEQLKIYTQTGELISVINSRLDQVNVSSYANGVYYFSLRSNGKRLIQKFVKI